MVSSQTMYGLRSCLCSICIVLAISSAAQSVEPKRFASEHYSLAFHDDGRTVVFAKVKGKDVPVGTLGAFRFPAMEVESGARTALNTTATGFSEKDKVHFANIATAVDAHRSGWPQVTVDYACKKGGVQAVWTMMPDMVLVQYIVSPPKDAKSVEGPAMVSFTPAEGQKLAEQIKPSRWFRHSGGGVPYQLTAGRADRYDVGEASFFLANDKGFDPLVDKDGVHVLVRDVPRPWLTNQLRANLVIGFGSGPSAMTTGVDVASEQGLSLHVRSPQPFYVWEDANSPIMLTADVSNLFGKSQRVDVTFTARDFDGRIVGSGSASKRLGPQESWKTPIRLTVKEAGPIYLDVIAKHSYASAFQNLCVGILPKREFLDGHASRFGMAAYRSSVGPHTERRPERQILELMSRMGVRWLRMAEDHALAHKMGLFPWYHNSIDGSPECQQYFAGQPTWMDDPKNRENWLTGNLQKVLEQKNEYFEFSNEWNLYGGEEKGARAEKYVKDWMTLLKPLRDKLAPNVKLTGLTVANGDLVYMEKVYRAGGWDKFDALAFHAAGVPRSVDFDDGNTYWSYLATLRRIREVVKKYGEKELWMTEMYTPAAPNSSCSNNERVSAEDTTLSIALAIAADVRGILYFCFDDYDVYGEIKTGKDVGEPSEREQYFGLVRRDWTPKTGLWAYQTAAYYFDGAKFVGDAKLPDKDVFGLVFEGRNGPFTVIWSRKEGYTLHEAPLRVNTHREPWEDVWTERTSVRVPAAAGEVSVVDCVGRVQRLKPDATGNVKIEVTGAPVYVVGGKFNPVRGKFSTILRP